MNQSTTKVRKGRSSEVNKDTQKTAKNNVVPKVNDIKADVGKQTDKSQILPTPEQLRIAQIIDMKTDDPYIKDKLKQVMDATQTSADDAYTALHDADNDINKAVNLLLEGGVKDEWSTLSKKKKARTVSEKSKENNVQPTTTPTENLNQNQNEGEDFENMVPIPVFNAKTEGRGGGRSGGRAFHKDRRGGRSGQNNANLVNSINEKTDKNAPRGARNQTNGPSNKGSRSFRGGRQGRGSRGRGGGGSMFRRPIENWDDNLHQNDINNTPQAIEDWDSEEFTGSLANSQVFTASAPVKSKSSEIDMPPLIQGDQRSPIRTPPSSEPITHTFTSAQILTHYASIQQQLSLDNQNLNKNMARESDILSHVNSGMHEINVLNSSLPLTSVGRSSGIVPSSLSLSHALGRTVSASPNKTMTVPPVGRSSMPVVSSMSLSNRATSLIGTSSTNTLSLSAVVAGRNSLSGSMPPLPKSDVFGRGKSPLLNYSRAEENRLGRLNARGKPRIPPPSKIPLTAVEMPPDGDSSIGRLDVQFGAMDLGESSSDTLPNTPPSPQRSSPSPPPADNFSGQNNTQVNETLISSDSRSFSPVSGSVSNSLSNQLSDVGPTKISETTSSSLYQDTVYQSSLYTKSPQQHQGIYNSTYTTGQAFTTSSAIYSNTSTSQSSYSSTVGNYGTNSYPYNYPNYQSSHQATTQPSTNNHNSYQSANNQYGIGGSHSGYGNSSLATSSYTMPYQTYNNSSQHKASLPSAPSSKEYESPNPTVNLSSIAHTASISGTSTLLSSSQTTPTSKTTGSSTMSKGTMVANMPQPLVGTPQYIVNQGTMPYFQQQPTPVFYEDLQLMPQQRLPHLPGGYYEVGYQPSTTREYSLSDGRFARADNTSPVPSITQQSGSQAHQQQLMNPTMPPAAYAYFYGGSVIPGNFSFSAPTIYPVAATGSTTGHGSTNTGSYGKGPTYTGSYAGMYENSQQNVDGYKSSASQVTKVQPTQSVNPSTSSDISNIYSKSHSALSKSYDKPGYCATPPPYSLGSQNSGIGPGGYPPHLFIPTLTPHHSTQLMHQPLHQDGGSSVSGRSQVNSQQNKQSKNNYSSSTYWAQN